MAPVTFDLSTTVARRYRRTATNKVATGGQAVIVGPITFPSGRISGSGTWQTYVTLEVAGNNRAVLQRKTTVDGTGAVTGDVIECRLVAAGTDPAPQTFTVASLPANLAYLKIAVKSDLQTVSYQAAAADLAFVEMTTRSNAAVSFDQSSFVEIGLTRPTTDTVVPATLTVARARGTTAVTPNPPVSGSAKSDTALHFDGTVRRVFPAFTGTVGTLLMIGRPTVVSRPMAVVSESRGSQGILDDFTRADGALGANWVGAGGTTPVVSGNAASSGASVTNGRALWNTGLGTDASAFVTLSAKPAAPASVLFNWLQLFARVSGTTTTATGYALSLTLLSDGTSLPSFTRILNGAIQGSMANLPTLNVNAGDSVGFRVVGTTLQMFYKPIGGVWAQHGTNYSETTFNYTTGTRIGFGVAAQGTDPTAVDNFSGSVETTTDVTTGSFPNDYGGRYMRLYPAPATAHTVAPWYWDATLTPPAGQGAAWPPIVTGSTGGTISIADEGVVVGQVSYTSTTGGSTATTSGWTMSAVTRDPSTGQVSVRMWEASSGTFSHVENAGTLAAGAALTGVLVIGGAQAFRNNTDLGFDGDLALVAVGTSAITATQFEGLVQNGTVSPNAVSALPGIARNYPLVGLGATDQILDVTTNVQHETTASRAGTLTVTTDTGNVPVGGTAVGGGGGGTSTVSVPDPTGFSVTNKAISAASPTTLGTLTLNVTAPAAGANYTPHASPIQFLYSDDGGVTWTGLGWQSATTKAITDHPLTPYTDAPDTPRGYSVQYRNNSATPIVGVLADPIFPVIYSIDPLVIVGVDPLPGGLRVRWQQPAGNVAEIRERHKLTTGGTFTTQQTAGLGTPVGDGTFYGDITGLTPGSNYTIELQPYEDVT